LTVDQNNLLKTWIAAILWLVLIWAESSNYGSAEYTSRFLYPVLHFLFGVSPAKFPVWQHLIRKTGHFVGYFTLSLLLFRSWRATLKFPGANWTVWWAGISFFMTALVASLDEWHQSYLPSRTGTWHDVVLDSMAALVAQILLYIFLRSRRPTSPCEQTPAEV
jgi:VanZ family protein